MTRAFLFGLVLASAAFGFADADVAAAADRTDKNSRAQTSAAHQPTAYRKKKPRTAVKGYVGRRGGYSYYASDSINTYGDARSLYGGTGYFRDFNRDRQSLSGPFDHGFFFDSGTHPRGGDSPYMR